jgi:hypothetical protein
MNEKSHEEFDLFYVFQGIKRFGDRIAHAVRSLVMLTIRKALVLFLFIVIGGALGYFLYKSRQNFYTATMSISHTRLDNDYCEEVVKLISSSIDGRTNADLAKILKISGRTARQVKSIEFKPFFEKPPRRFHDSVLAKLPFRIEAEIFNSEILDSLQISIVNYLESSQFAMHRKEVDQQALMNVIDKIDKQIIETDSLKTIVNQAAMPRGNSGALIWGEPLNPVVVYARELDIYEKKITLQKRLQLNNSFEVLTGFTMISSSAHRRRISYPFVGMVLGYLVGLAWVISRRPRNSIPAGQATGAR